MGSKSKPKYATTTFNSGNWGSSTNSESGTTYNPTDWMNTTMNTVSANVNPTLQGMLSNDFSNDPNFQVYQNNFNRNAAQAFDTNVLSSLANRGLMRSSGLQGATNAFNNTLVNDLSNLYDSYYNRQSNNLSNLLNTSNTLYNYMAGITGKNQADTQAVNQFNMDLYKTDKAAQSALYSALGQAVGAVGAAAKKSATGGAV